MPNGRPWRGEYIVAALRQFDELDFSAEKPMTISTQRARTVHFQKGQPVAFPLRDAHDKHRRSAHTTTHVDPNTPGIFHQLVPSLDVAGGDDDAPTGRGGYSPRTAESW